MLIPIDTILLDVKGDLISSGIVLNTTDSISLYTTFLSKNMTLNISALHLLGFLYFDKEEKEYQISNKEKLSERSLPEISFR